ncbi:SERPINE1 mRNA-binding protein 1-like isoform X2 [Mytilus trossulus]|uniref:SERPINE1 mRNA-binding protein 1-like isoform X2 n=1 Tax=Mytilus trossulus TaxID=6551 RepID=UPI003007AEA6
MDSQYGIAVTNKFCLFDDDDDVDPYEILKQEELKRTEALAKEKADKSKPTKKTKKTAPQTDNKTKLTEQNTQKKEEKVVPSQARNQQNERPPRSARQNRENREPREDRRPRRPEENSSMTNETRDKPEGGFGNRMESRGGFSGRPRGRGGPRGRGRGGFDRGGFSGKREFERHSGSDRTGVKSMEKREGSGAHNWGTFKDDLDEEASKENEEPKESWNQGEDAENQDPNESTESTEQTVAEGEKTPKQLTLDEWKAQEEKKRLKTDFNLRKPNEGSDSSQLKGTAYKKQRNTSDDEEEEDDEEEYEEEDDHKSKSQLPIRITFNDSPRRGGRGGRRPRGGRGPRGSMGRGDRRGNSRDTAPRFDDEADFPSLVKSAA